MSVVDQRQLPHEERETQRTSRPRKVILYETSRKESSLSWPVDYDFTQGLQHLTFVVLKISINLTDTLLLHHPQLAVSFSDESGIMADNNHSFEGRWQKQGKERKKRMSKFVMEPQVQKLDLPSQDGRRKGY